MDIPDISELEKAAADIVIEARSAGTIASFTPRIIRQKIEEKFNLEKGVLDEDKYKKAIKAAIDAANKSKSSKKTPGEPEEHDNEVGSPNSKPGSKAVDTDKPKGKKRKSDDTKDTTPKKKKRKSDDGSKKKQAEKKKQESKTFKSAETVSPTSESEEDEGETQTKSRPRKKVKKVKKVQPASDDEVPSEHEDTTKKPSSSTNKDTDTTPTDIVMEDPKSDTELSDLIDEPPKRKTKGKGKDKEKPIPKEKKGKKTAVTLSKDEETIKRLKGLVNACGVRKVWAKAFKGIEDQPSKQIKMLKGMLADLGMTGRLSIEQAKEIKAKRELAQELEDVQSFEKAIMKQSTRRSRQPSIEKQGEKEDEDSPEEEDVKPGKRKGTARQRVMAFLEDQSDSD